MTKNEFYNKNIVITGGSSGIGLSAAFYFLNNNANVIVICHDGKSTEKLFKEKKFVNARIIVADLEKREEVEQCLKVITRKFRSIDVLINCAGIKYDGDLENTCFEDFDYTLNLNLRSVFLFLQPLRPYFVNGSSIINLSCLYGTRPMYGVISYAMSKAGLETLTRYAAAEFSNLGVRINAISACPVDTNSLRYIKVNEGEINFFKQKMEERIPMGRIARTPDIVKVIVFLASKRSSKITGQIIKVDGGRSLTTSGYIHYKGLNNMNTLFEPNYINIKNIKDKCFQKEEILENPITDKDQLKQFVEKVITQSNFTSRDVDAHFNVSTNYYPVNTSNSFLANKYLNGNLPNELLTSKEKKKNEIDNNEENDENIEDIMTNGENNNNANEQEINEDKTEKKNYIIPKKRYFNQFPKVGNNIDKGKFEEDDKNFEFKNIANQRNDSFEKNEEEEAKNQNEEKGMKENEI